MATNLDIDPKLLDKARRLAGLRTKRETVEKALEEFVRHREQSGILDLEGELDYFDGYDPKKLRSRKAK